VEKTLLARLMAERERGCRGGVEDRAPSSLGVWHRLAIGMGRQYERGTVAALLDCGQGGCGEKKQSCVVCCVYCTHWNVVVSMNRGHKLFHREPFACQIRPCVMHCTVAIPGPAIWLVGLAPGRWKERPTIFSKSWHGHLNCSTKKYQLVDDQAHANTPAQRRSHGCPEEDAQVCADEESHW
jgi:hypothetical protein